MPGRYDDLPAAGRETADHHATERPASATDDGDAATPNNHNDFPVDRGSEPTFRPRAVARALAAIIALLAVGLAGFLFANNAAQISPSQVAPIHLPAAIAPSPSAPELTDLGLNDLASVVTIEAELENGAEELLGTGWIFDNLGDVVTNAHVINGDDTLRVTDRDDHTQVARVVQSDANADLAMLRVTGTLSGTPLPVDTRPLSDRSACR